MFRLRNVYLYVVSFVTLMMIMIGLIFTINYTTDVLFPTTYYYNTPYQNDSCLTDEQLQEIKENDEKNQITRSLETKKNVAKSITVVIIALPTFLYHWLKIEKERNIFR